MNARLLLVFTLLIVSVGCKEEFLHYRIPTDAPEVSQNQTLKELVNDGSIDILWVIDNSGSMSAHQQSVIRNTAAFIDPFTKNKFAVNWKMGLISTSYSESPYLGFFGAPFNNQTPNPVKVFQSAVGRLGTGGATSEMTFDPILKAFSSDRAFLRKKDAYLAFIVVTDAPEQSFRFRNAASFLTELKNFKPDLSKVFAYGIFSANDLGCPATDDFWNYKGSSYEQVFSSFGAHKIFNLCKDDFGVALAEIGKDLARKSENFKFYLDKRPIVSTLSVFNAGVEIPFGPKENGGFWVYDNDLNAVIFHDISFAKGDYEKITLVYTPDSEKD